MQVLVTGGAGFIGSHTLVELINNGYEVVVIDNLSNSSMESVKRVEKITNTKIPFVLGDVNDENILKEIFSKYDIGFVIHFAGLKAVGESVSMPLEYYSNNIGSTLTLLKVMREFNVKNIVFSSSATVYGDPEKLPLTEDCSLKTTNPYGSTKLMQEYILQDLYVSDKDWNITILRYFNPIGAHESGLIGEDPKGIPNNLMPYVAQVASGKLEKVRVFGNDYPTIDGTGVRDYIHVVDLARGHVLSIKNTLGKGVHVYNLGTGNGYSVLQMIENFAKVSEREVPYVITDRRPGDIAECYACPDKAEKEIGFKAEFGLYEMCKHQWNWQKNNPNGYNK